MTIKCFSGIVILVLCKRRVGSGADVHEPTWIKQQRRSARALLVGVRGLIRLFVLDEKATMIKEVRSRARRSCFWFGYSLASAVRPSPTRRDLSVKLEGNIRALSTSDFSQ